MSGKKIVECVPNFSDGRNKDIVDQIVGSLGDEVQVLDCDMGDSTNRTVLTYIGEPEKVISATLRLIAKANELIDMRFHHGEHPRFGAVDVVPIIPVSNVTMEEAVEISRIIAKKAGEMGVSVYCYEYAAFTPKRKNLSVIREGEYEKLKEKLEDPEWKPDFGPSEFQPKTGATAIGARQFLVAVNYSLNTTSTRRANSVAFDVREQGRVKRKPNFGDVILDPETGEPARQTGTCPGTKAIGWFIEEYGCCQVSMNICDISKSPLHFAFEEVCKSALARGMRVTGTEIVGLVPKNVMLEAGRYFLKKQQRSLGVPDSHLIEIAIISLGLSNVKIFDPEKQIIEHNLPKPLAPLIKLDVRGFALATASESPAPGGGSVAALVGGLAGALGTMVANLSSHKRGWDGKWEYYSQYAEKGMKIMESLIRRIDEDTHAFNKVMECFKIPKSENNRQQRINEAYHGAIDVPLGVMRDIRKTFEILEVMAKEGLPTSLSDVGVGAACALAGAKGAYLNVVINLNDIKKFEEEKEYVNGVLDEAKTILRETEEFEKKLWLEMTERLMK